jgi:hypothetical protein
MKLLSAPRYGTTGKQNDEKNQLVEDDEELIKLIKIN